MFLLPQTNETQLVTHLNYTGWPDHGTPSQPDQLLTFISFMRHVHRSGPIITHCSAGIGRSGTLICIDTVLGLISKDADVRRLFVCLFFVDCIRRKCLLFILFVHYDHTLISLSQQFDISDVVRNMRLQRQGMVQTEVNFNVIHF